MRGWVALLLVLTLLPAGCGSRQPVVGFLLGGLENERYYKDLACFRESAAELGAQVVFRAGNDDPPRQLALAREMLDEGVQVMVAQPLDAEHGDKIMAACRERDVLVIGYDRLYEGSSLSPMLVTQDSPAVGRLQAEYAARAIGGKGQVLIVRGLAGHLVADEITRGNLEVLETHPGIEVLPPVANLEWDVASGYTTTTAALARGKLAAVLCNNSAMARGAIKAIAEAGQTGQVYVAGADADLENCQQIIRGEQGMDVLKEIAPLAEAAARAAVALARGSSPQWQETMRFGNLPIQVIRTPVQAFDRTNLDSVVIETGFHPREAVYLKGLQ